MSTPMGATGRRGYVDGPAQLVAGFPAHVIATALHRVLAAEIRDYSPERRREVLEVFGGIQEAAAAYRTAGQARAVADRRNDATSASDAPPLSDQISTAELALLLGKCLRQALNVGKRNELGVRVGGRWVWSRTAATAYLDQERDGHGSEARAAV